MRLILSIVLFVLAGCSSSKHATNARGLELAQNHCSSCHAIGATGESPRPEAPPFRTLSRHYRVDTLQEALAEGISVGHPAMPQFQFAADDVDALIAYLQSIQEDGAASPNRD